MAGGGSLRSPDRGEYARLRRIIERGAPYLGAGVGDLILWLLTPVEATDELVIWVEEDEFCVLLADSPAFRGTLREALGQAVEWKQERSEEE